MIAELFLLEPLFPGATDFEMVNLIFNFLGYSEHEEEILKPKIKIQYKEAASDVFEKTFDCADEEAIDLLKQMICVDPVKRLDIDGVLSHPYLEKEEDYMDVNLPI